MSFNITKFKFMTVDKISDVRHYTANKSCSDFFVSVTDQEIDLRVVFENDLSLSIMLASVFVKLIRFLA